jgi:glycosyltransferase involved in cell wall biosynthesis
VGKVLTVVVPSYNTEQYMDECIPTFLANEILEDIEVLIIDDGSKDGTAKKGLEFEKRYPRTVKLVSKENGGHGSTINKGIEIATGKYFKVVDGDDWVDTNAFVRLVNYLKSTDSDLIASQYCRISAETGEKVKRRFPGITFEYEYQFDNIVNKIDRIEMHAITIKTSILSDHQIAIDENKYYVDVEFILFPIQYVNTVVFLEDYLYMYRVCVATQSMSVSSLQKNKDMHYDVFFILVDFYNQIKNKISREKQDYISKRLAFMAWTQYKIYLSLPNDVNSKKELGDFDQKLKREIIDIYGKNTSRQISALRFNNLMLYRVIYRYNNKKSRINDL